MEWRTQYARDSSEYYTCAGNSVRPVYSSKVNDSGILELQMVGEEDTYPLIQSFKDSCSINYLLAKYANGDVNALSKVQGVYGDFTELPKSFAEVLQRVIDGENFFNSLPLDVRQQFGNDFRRWFAEAGTDSWLASMGITFSNSVPDDVPDDSPVDPVS